MIVRPPMAKKYSSPMLRSWPNRPGANGMTRSVITLARYVTTGARVKTVTSAPVGAKSSLVRTLRPWTTLIAEPHGPIRFGPTLRFIRAMTFSSR